MLDQQSFQRTLPDPLKCSPLSSTDIRESASDDNSSTADPGLSEVYDPQQFTWNSLDDVSQVLQSLTISSNADVQSNQSSSSAYSSSYSSPTSTSYGPLGGHHQQQLSSMGGTQQQSRLSEWVSSPGINSWPSQNTSMNPAAISRPVFNTNTNPMGAPPPPGPFGTPFSNQTLAAQLALNPSLQSYLNIRNSFKSMPGNGGGRRVQSNFGARESSIMPSKVSRSAV